MKILFKSDEYIYYINDYNKIVKDFVDKYNHMIIPHVENMPILYKFLNKYNVEFRVYYEHNNDIVCKSDLFGKYFIIDTNKHMINYIDKNINYLKKIL